MSQDIIARAATLTRDELVALRKAWDQYATRHMTHDGECRADDVAAGRWSPPQWHEALLAAYDAAVATDRRHILKRADADARQTVTRPLRLHGGWGGQASVHGSKSVDPDEKRRNLQAPWDPVHWIAAAAARAEVMADLIGVHGYTAAHHATLTALWVQVVGTIDEEPEPVTRKELEKVTR